MDILVGTSDRLAPNTVHELARYRHRVFIEKLGWELATQNGFELDQFDRDDTIYIVSRDSNGEVNGTARLLSTENPYLLGEVFPQLLPGQTPPRDSKIWELSRFAATDFSPSQGNALSQFSSPTVVALLDTALSTAAGHGVERVITVSPLGIERLLRRYGFSARRAGPPTIVDGHLLFACWIDVEPRDSIGYCSAREVIELI